MEKYVYSWMGKSFVMTGWLDGRWIDGWMNGWMDGWMEI